MIMLRSAPNQRAFFLAVWMSLLVAALGFYLGPGRFLLSGSGSYLPNGSSLKLCTYLAAAWVVIFLLSAFSFKRKALWLLLAAPFALYWPLMWGLVGKTWAW